MANLERFDNSQSPFDTIRRIDEKGKECWYARELMDLMEYKQWRRFKEVIENAIENIETVSKSALENFLPVEAKTKGRTRLDYKLSRFACYHIALCCDSRGNNSVKMAKHYFAVKTREAEVVIPKQNEKLLFAQLELEKIKLENENLKLKIHHTEKREAIATIHSPQFLALLDGRPDAVLEIKDKVTETVVCKDGRNVSFEGKSTAQLAKELGFKTGKLLEQWLIQQNAEHLICQGMRAVQAQYIPSENVGEVKRLFAQQRQNSSRQMVIGE